MSASSLFVEGGASKIDTRFLSPLNTNVDCNGYSLSAIGTASATEVRAEQIALPDGSLETEIAIEDSIKVTGSIKATAIPSATYANVLGYNPANGSISYQPAGGGGGGGDAYGVFTYSATAPHGVDSWYENTATNIAFSNTGSAANQAWLGALQAALQTLADVYIQVVQGSNIQSLKVVSVTPGVGFTFVEYLTATIPPMWVDGATTDFYYTLAGPAGPGGINANYGNFYSTATQLLAPGGTAITFSNTADANGVLSVGSQIVVLNAGTYSFTFSAQIVGGANEQVALYFNLNGLTIADSASYVEVKNGEAQIMTINFIATLGAGNIIEVIGRSASGLSSVQYIAPSGATPASPSIIFTIHQLAYQGPQGPTGPQGPPGGLTNPLTSDITAAGFSLNGAGTVQANTIQTSTNPAIDIASPVLFTDPTLPAQFTLPPQTAVAPTVGNDITNKTYVDSRDVNLAGLFNFLRIVPTATGQSVSPVYYTGGSGVGYPSSWIPDATPNTTILPNAGVGNSWELLKPASPAGATQRWWVWPFNPQYGLTPPFSQPPPPTPLFLKKNLNALYAIIRVKGATNITIQGAIFWNIYTYDYTTPPASPQSYSTRFDYQANNLALPYTTGAMALQTGFTYLVYAADAEKIVATPSVLTTIAQANGQTPSQLTSEMLRDPYDIHTDIPHIPLSAVSVNNGAVVPSDINNVPVSALTFACPSNAITNGANIELIALGYRANGGAVNVEYNLQYS